MKKFIFVIIFVLVVTGFVSWYITPNNLSSVCKAETSTEDINLKQKIKAQEIIARLRRNFDGLNKVSYQVQWDSQNNDDGESSFLTDIKFKRPFYYLEKGIKNRIYTYISDGEFEKFTYEPTTGDSFTGKSESPPTAKVNEAGFLERFPLRILQTKNVSFVGEEVIDFSGNQITCEVIRDDYWQLYVDKNSNLVIRADYYRESGNIEDVIISIRDIKYSAVKIVEKKFVDFPVSFNAVSCSTNYTWKCSISNLKINTQTSFDNSIFKLKKPDTKI